MKTSEASFICFARNLLVREKRDQLFCLTLFQTQTLLFKGILTIKGLTGKGNEKRTMTRYIKSEILCPQLSKSFFHFLANET